jgi:uncharacterized protein
VDPFATFAWTMRGLAGGIAATAPLLVGLWWCRRTRSGPVRRLVRLVQTRLGPWLAGASGAELLLVAACAGIGEEALFRGVVQAALLHRVPEWVALGLTAVLFGAAHALSATYAALATLMGVYLGWLQLAGDNLLVPTLTHALYDLLALQLLLGVKDTPPSSVL